MPFTNHDGIECFENLNWHESSLTENMKRQYCEHNFYADDMPTIVQKCAKRILIGLIVAAAILLNHNAMATPTTVDLGTASGFAILAGSGITVAGAVNTTTITGDIGTYPTPAITGLGNVVLNGANQTSGYQSHVECSKRLDLRI